ncbi:2OG-Fe dioxygenase family protein [Caballeronia sp. LjRoot34]|uniref:2OG-Fe dioxygenase family protein n=1 Tax=Caballeronia sp. LjRoot34 TaxID=3342325 RepID=UPI003ECC76C3
MKLQQHQTKRSQNHISSHLLRGLLQTQGFVIFRASELGYRQEPTPAQRELIELAKSLGADPYAKNCSRYRCLHRGVFIPSKGALIFTPSSVDEVTGEKFNSYLQGEENQEHANLERRFSPMPVKMQRNTALRDLVKRDFRVTPFSDGEDDAYAVTFHVIRHVVAQGEKAASSPDLIHTDDVLLSFVHVLERTNVVGGVNCIARIRHEGKAWNTVPIEDVLAQTTVTEPFDGYAFIDDAVGHYVSPIEVAAGHVEGARTVLIVDFAPLRPARTLELPPLKAA